MIHKLALVALMGVILSLPSILASSDYYSKTHYYYLVDDRDIITTCTPVNNTVFCKSYDNITIVCFTNQGIRLSDNISIDNYGSYNLTIHKHIITYHVAPCGSAGGGGPIVELKEETPEKHQSVVHLEKAIEYAKQTNQNLEIAIRNMILATFFSCIALVILLFTILKQRTKK